MNPTRLHRYAAALALAAAAVSFGAAPQAHAQTFGGNVGFNWSIPNAPATGLTDVTFPMTLNTATKHVSANYVAQQFFFTDQANGAYTGLQPRPDRFGVPRIHGVFSSFIANTTTGDSHCSLGADGGAGVSCAVDFNGVYGRRYDVKVTRVATDTYSGDVVDTTTGAQVHIGTFTVPAGSGLIESTGSGFVENYNTISCSTVPKIDATIGGPSTSSGLSGTTYGAHEYGDCLGQANYSSSISGSGVRVIRGY